MRKVNWLKGKQFWLLGINSGVPNLPNFIYTAKRINQKRIFNSIWKFPSKKTDISKTMKVKKIPCLTEAPNGKPLG